MKSSTLSWRLVVLLSFVLPALLAGAGLRQPTALRVAGAGMGAAVLFFLVSNFGVWVGSTMYPPALTGLGTCYVAALPFFSHPLVSDLVYCTVLFGGFALAQRQVAGLRQPVVLAA